ncbi:winged helix DNA-binding domain-containing protein [Nocardioides sp.]|uniref:winged helix DNA-binding domain-containing protein n=1 Tax=Nocardioides sp. TaxID=35761 RepID=UPI0039E3E2B2
MTILTARALNRTLLRRQGLLARSPGSVHGVVHDLIGLQAQESLPPYLSLAARLAELDPHDVTQALADRSLVRILSLRDTVHLHVPQDAVTLPVWAEPVRQREERSSRTIGPARAIDADEFRAVLAELLTGPRPLRELSAALAERYSGHPPAALGNLARLRAPLLQVPPRGGWKASGGVVYEYVDRWTGLSLTAPDLSALVRRYLRGYGPASAADMTTWSGVTRLGPVLAATADLVRHSVAGSRVVLYDVPEGEVVEDVHAPVRLLGSYDNLWLSHATRDRMMTPAGRAAWMGSNGASAGVVLADGYVAGLWRPVEGRVVLDEPLRSLTRRERVELDEEVDRVEALLAR